MSGFDKARDAAWTKFGHRWWKWIIGWHFAKLVLPFALAGVLVGTLLIGAWRLAHNPTVVATGRTIAVAATVAAVIAWITWAVRRWSNPIMPAAWGMRLASVVVTIAGLAAVWRWT
jgi:hypothetical protein